MSQLTPEPEEDRATVCYLDHDGRVCAVFVRDDRHHEDGARWLAAYDPDDIYALTWAEVLQEGRGLRGPYLMRVVGRD